MRIALHSPQSIGMLTKWPSFPSTPMSRSPPRRYSHGSRHRSPSRLRMTVTPRRKDSRALALRSSSLANADAWEVRLAESPPCVSGCFVGKSELSIVTMSKTIGSGRPTACGAPSFSHTQSFSHSPPCPLMPCRRLRSRLCAGGALINLRADGKRGGCAANQPRWCAVGGPRRRHRPRERFHCRPRRRDGDCAIHGAVLGQAPRVRAPR